MLISPVVAQGNEFGHSVSVFGTRAIVGEILDDRNNRNNIGSAHIYDLIGNQWVPTATLFSSGYDPGNDDYFGSSVALGDGVAVVGASGFSKPGHAVVFELQGTNWSPAATFQATDAMSGEGFGKRVAIDGERIAIGANETSTRSGAVYIYERTNGGWQQTAKIVANDPQAFSEFGSALALKGNTLVVGAHESRDANNINHGAVYVFDFDDGTWNQSAKIVLPDSVLSCLRRNWNFRVTGLA